MIASLIRTRRALFAAGLSLLLAGPAAAVTDPNAAPDCLDNDPGAGIFFICFDDLVSLTTTGAQDFGPVSIDDATVFSEADAALALGFDTSTWATTGDQGILNNLVPVIDFSFDQTVFLFRVDVVVLPGQSGDPGLVVVQGYRDGDLVAVELSDPSGVQPDGTHENRILIKDVGGFDQVLVFAAAGPCDGFDCEPGFDTTTFFADSVKYVLPEPGTLAMVSMGLLGLAGMGRRRTAGAEGRSS